MEINYIAVLVCGVASMIIGSIWYGPIFGKTWMRLNHAEGLDPVKLKEMQKKAAPLYLVQFLLTLFQAFVLSYYIHSMPQSGLDHAMWIWAGFILPTVAAGTMWTSESNRAKWTRFGIQVSYQLVAFIVFGLILGMWM